MIGEVAGEVMRRMDFSERLGLYLNRRGEMLVAGVRREGPANALATNRALVRCGGDGRE